MENNGLLKGVRVVELSSFVAAPCCAKLLGDWGAEVIKIEPLGGDGIRVMGGTFKSPYTDEENPMFELENGNKKGISVNVKTKEGVEVLHKLLEKSDIFVTNVREQALAKMGLTYDQLKDAFPGLIHAHILGYGEEGPLKDKPGFDYTAYFARGGVSQSLMEKGTSPCNTAAGFGDHYAGISLAAGIMAALYKKQITGEGDKVTVSLFHTALYGMGMMVTTSQYGNEMPISRAEPNSPLMTTYRCKDDKWIQLALIQYNKWLPKFCDVINRKDIMEDDRFNDISVMPLHVNEMVEIVEKAMLEKTLDEWSVLLDAADLPFEKVQSCEDLLTDEQAWANDFLFKTTYANGNEGVLVNGPVKFKTMGIKEYSPAPRIGEHTEEVLRELGYNDDEISAMVSTQAIKVDAVKELV
ncbi:CaiB/BaiF CoA transferase family protein [Metaclostridioides mangenotii]|uniref:CaiB/BaiF CoA transferase family protein n=1 Tax=Metaclostridioides mangenotii TaxID=1540 RepID=UPI0026F3471A|nr:CoA transferase [Clostridioides mangenotii]